MSMSYVCNVLAIVFWASGMISMSSALFHKLNRCSVVGPPPDHVCLLWLYLLLFCLPGFHLLSYLSCVYSQTSCAAAQQLIEWHCELNVIYSCNLFYDTILCGACLTCKLTSVC